MLTRVGSSGDDDEGRAPICPSCGVTALPAELSNVLDSGFVCENPDCDAFGERVGYDSSDIEPPRHNNTTQFHENPGDEA